ncbi:TspO/MBR family protein [Inquilinus sp. CAU 1745]|uniref:TspO/MBR family protein n=1 Tax=Inquilinus sp. CAU 1745 TaxID=3140369 RepID=UPI00325C1D86
MPETRRRTILRIRDLLALAAFVALCLLVSAIGGAVTATSVGGWYQELEKPFFTPPDWLFGPVWAVLYLMIAVAGWRIWRLPRSERRTRALIHYAMQLSLNLAWSMLFFGAQAIGAAAIEIAILLYAILRCIALFQPLDRMAAILFAPYAAWVAYAAILNAAIWLLN